MADQQNIRPNRTKIASDRQRSWYRDEQIRDRSNQLPKVLFVEGNEFDRALLTAALSGAGWSTFEVSCASSLAAAIGALSIAPVDVVVTELDLPDSSGLETCRRLAVAVPGVPIVVLGDHDDEGLSVAIVAAGAQDYLVKGVNVASTLPRAIRLAIERMRRQHTNDGSRQNSLPDPAALNRLARLTARQREVFRLLVQGKTLKQVSAQLGICVQAATKHRAKILRTCEVNTDAELVHLMFAAGWPIE